MGIQLWIAEKPSMAKDIAYVLGGKQATGIKYECSYQGQKIWVSWSIGHLLGIAAPEEHDPKWKSWKPELLPIIPVHIQWQALDRTGKHFLELKKLIQHKSVSSLVNACDAGREGELIFRTIFHACDSNLPVKRFWVSSLTVAAIKEGIQSLQPSEVYDPLGSAAYCRSIADWLVGMNGSRALTARANRVLTIGRVQTPTLAMIVNRDLEIEGFKPEPYWQVEVTLLSVQQEKWKALWRRSSVPLLNINPVSSSQIAPKSKHQVDFGDTKAIGIKAMEAQHTEEVIDEQEEEVGLTEAEKQAKKREAIGKIKDKAFAEALVMKVKQQYGKISQIKSKEESIPPPQLYHLTALQQDANIRFAFSADQTLKIAQRLYEYHKVISYPRTDARYLTPDLIPQIPKILAALPQDYQSACIGLKKAHQLGGRYVNAKKVNDHHAIIPTTKSIDLGSLNTDEKKIYDLIVRSLLMALSENALDAKLEVEAIVKDEIFWSQWKKELNAGWRKINPYLSKKEADHIAPQVKLGEEVRILEAEILDKETQPPPRFTEALLLASMEKAGNQLEEKDLKQLLKGSGLGTPATRANILENLIHRQYLQRAGKHLLATETGKALIASIQNQELKSVHLTANWEQMLKEIEEGKMSPVLFFQRMREFIPKMNQELLQASYIHTHQPSVIVGTSVAVKAQKQSTGGAAKKRSIKAIEGESASLKNTRSRKKAISSQASSSKVKTEQALPSAITQVLCLKCKLGPMVKGRTAFGCSRWREGCHFTVPFQFDGIFIQERQAIELLVSKKIRNVIEKEGNYYDIILVLDQIPPMKLQINPQSKSSQKTALSPQAQANRYQNLEISSSSWRNLTQRNQKS